MLRLIDNSTLRDRRHIKDMLEKHNLPSMNQLAAQIKLTEAWKSINKESFPVKLVKQHPNLDQTTSKMRSTTTKLECGIRQQELWPAKRALCLMQQNFGTRPPKP